MHVPMLAPTTVTRASRQQAGVEQKHVEQGRLGTVKIPTLTVLLIAVVALIVLGTVVHVLGGITKLLVLVVVVLGIAIWIRNWNAKRRA